MNTPPLIFIVGPTASGKTELALEEAERTGAIILSCDSLCVYRGMDIGTAKPTPGERARVPHYGIDLADPAETFSVDRYIAYRDPVLEQCRKSGQPVIVCGGSGFYLKSFFAPVVDRIDVPETVRERVECIRERDGPEGLVRELRAIHGPGERFAGLDLRNPRRVEKALMRCLASGRSYSDLQAAFESLPEPLAGWRKEVRLVVRSTEDLRNRNRKRVARMLEHGLIDEVRALRAQGFERNPSACGAIGYREVLEYLDRPTSAGDLAEAIFTHTNQLMRKQRTWFRNQIPVHREWVLS